GFGDVTRGRQQRRDRRVRSNGDPSPRDEDLDSRGLNPSDDEGGANGTHGGSASSDLERPAFGMRDREQGLAASQDDLPDAAVEVDLDCGVGVEQDNATVGEHSAREAA